MGALSILKGLRRLLLFMVLTVTAVMNTAEASGLRFVSTYLQAGQINPDQNYLPELDGTYSPYDRLSAAHMSPSFFKATRGYRTLTRAIIGLGPSLFLDHGILTPGYESVLDQIGKDAIDGYRGQILALYVADEPTAQGITRSTLETLIDAIHRRFPGIPTYVVYPQDCFDNSPGLDAKCGLSGQRGIPSNLDWVGFDWYATSQSQLENTLVKLQAMTNKPIVLVSEGMNEFLQGLTPAWQDYFLSSRFGLYLALADQYPQVIGIDNYDWADHIENGVYVSGSRNFPATRRALFNAAGPLINPSIEGNLVLNPPRSFGGIFSVYVDGRVSRFYKAAGNTYYCSFRNEAQYQQDLGGLVVPRSQESVFTDITGLYDNGPCH
jgi:hypothetical protein